MECAYFIFGTHVQCYPDWVLNNYCPKIVTKNQNTVPDGGKLVTIYVDSLGGRVSPSNISTIHTASRFFIGDSFIQADEMDYVDTIYGRFNEKEPGSAYALGYASWNPIQYFDAIKRIGRHNSKYYVFLMSNDVNPNYSRSVYQELKKNKFWMFEYYKRTYTFQILDIYITKAKLKYPSIFYEKNTEREKIKEFNDSRFNIDAVENCHSLEDLSESDYKKRWI